MMPELNFEEHLVLAMWLGMERAAGNPGHKWTLKKCKR